MPNYVFANNAGTTFVNGFFYLLAWGGDAILGIMQKLMIGTFDIEEGLFEKELLFAKIIRDADKLDIFYEGAEMFWNSEEEREKIGQSEISQSLLEKFKLYKKIERENRETPLDGIVEFISMIYNIYFKYDFVVLKQEDYVNKILNKFKFINEETKEQIKEIREIANKYIQIKLII